MKVNPQNYFEHLNVGRSGLQTAKKLRFVVADVFKAMGAKVEYNEEEKGGYRADIVATEKKKKYFVFVKEDPTSSDIAKLADAKKALKATPILVTDSLNYKSLLMKTGLKEAMAKGLQLMLVNFNGSYVWFPTFESLSEPVEVQGS
jgi:hypothetical protein